MRIAVTVGPVEKGIHALQPLQAGKGVRAFAVLNSRLYPPFLQAAGCAFAEPRAVSDTESKLRRQGPELRTQERWNR